MTELKKLIKAILKSHILEFSEIEVVTSICFLILLLQE